MAKYLTGNPIGSTDPRDLLDNSEGIDVWANSDEDTAQDRFGVSRRTISSMVKQFDTDQADRDARFNALLAASGYQYIGDYAAGITVTEYNQVIRDGGEFWRLSPSESLPYTTTGSGMPEGGAFVYAGDATIRQELSLDDGDTLIGTESGQNLRAELSRREIVFDSVADMKAATWLNTVSRKRVRTLGYYEPGDGGANDYEIVAAGTGTDDGGSYIDLPGSGLQAKGLFLSGSISVTQFGAVADGATDNTSVYSAIVEYASDNATVIWPKGDYKGTFISDKALTLIGNHSELIPEDGAFYTIYMSGEVSDPIILSGVPEYGDTAISSSHSAGQLLRLYSGMTRPEDSQHVNYEMLVVESGSTLATPVQSDQLGTTATVEEVAPIKNVSISGFRFSGDDDTISVYVQYADGVEIRDVKKTSGSLTTVSVRYSINLDIDNIERTYPSATGAGQGYNVSLYGVKNVNIGTVIGYGCRHTYDQDSAYNVEVGHIIDYSPASSPCALAHNGFAGNTRVRNLECVGLGSTYLAGTSSQGYNPDVDLIVSRNIGIDSASVVLRGNSSDSAAVIYQKQIADGFYVGELNIKFPGTYDKSLVLRPAVRIDYVPAGTIDIRNVYADGCNVGVWNYKVGTGGPAPVDGDYKINIDNLHIVSPRYAIGLFTDNVIASNVTFGQSPANKPDALLFYQGDSMAKLNGSKIEIGQYREDFDILPESQLAFIPIVSAVDHTLDAVDVDVSGTTITARDVFSRGGRVVLNAAAPATLSSNAIDVIPALNMIVSLIISGSDITIPLGSRLADGNSMVMSSGNKYDFVIDTTSLFRRLKLVGVSAYSV